MSKSVLTQPALPTTPLMCTHACAHAHTHTHTRTPSSSLPPSLPCGHAGSPSLSISFRLDPCPQTLSPPTPSCRPLSTYPIFFKNFITVCSELARYCFTCLFSVPYILLTIPDPRKAKAWRVLLRAVAWCLDVLPGTQQRPVSSHEINEQTGLRQKTWGRVWFPFQMP